MSNGNHTVEKLLLAAPGVVNYDRENEIEVKPGIWSPIYINLKDTFANVRHRRVVVNRLVAEMDDDYDVVCGVESGGNYHAGAVADALMTSVVFLRKGQKEYSQGGRIAGVEPREGCKIALVDDVLATGGTIKDAVEFFKGKKCNVSLFTIFSYGYEREISDRLGIPITTLSTFDSLMEESDKRNVFGKEDIAYLKEHVSTYTDRLVERL